MFQWKNIIQQMIEIFLNQQTISNNKQQTTNNNKVFLSHNSVLDLFPFLFQLNILFFLSQYSNWYKWFCQKTSSWMQVILWRRSSKCLFFDYLLFWKFILSSFNFFSFLFFGIMFIFVLICNDMCDQWMHIVYHCRNMRFLFIQWAKTQRFNCVCMKLKNSVFFFTNPFIKTMLFLFQTLKPHLVVFCCVVSTLTTKERSKRKIKKKQCCGTHSQTTSWNCTCIQQ